jgi:hypothetical protein
VSVARRVSQTHPCRRGDAALIPCLRQGLARLPTTRAVLAAGPPDAAVTSDDVLTTPSLLRAPRTRRWADCLGHLFADRTTAGHSFGLR